MAALGTLTILPSSPDPGLDFGFDLLRFNDGFPHADPVWLVEPVSAMGVNYTRLRKLRLDFPVFQMNVMLGTIDWGTAVAFARAWRQVKGRLATLSYTTGGSTYSISDPMYVEEVSAEPQPGELIAPGQITPGATAKAVGVFTLQCVRLPA